MFSEICQKHYAKQNEAMSRKIEKYARICAENMKQYSTQHGHKYA
jgi:hypothetical protein